MEQNEKEARAKEFGDYLFNIRREVGLTQVQLSEQLEVSQAFIQAIEAGKKRIPRDKMEAYSVLLKLEFDHLLRGHISGHDPEIYDFLTLKPF